jgi:WXG100 family type VII secretion target
VEIYVNYGQVENVEQALADADQAIQRVLANLQDVVNQLRPSWAGISEQEYLPVQARFNSDLTDMNSILVQYNQVLDEIKINYGTTDNNLALQWQQIT